MTSTPIEKFLSFLPAVAGVVLLIALLPALLACTGAPSEQDLETAAGDRSPAAKGPPSESWRCRNDLEVACADGSCKAETGGGFTPMDVRVDDSGAISVCAYTGCWEGAGELVREQKFLVWIGHDLEFSTARESESSGADIVIAIDRADGVATLKAGEFAHPLLCKNLGV